MPALFMHDDIAETAISFATLAQSREPKNRPNWTRLYRLQGISTAYIHTSDRATRLTLGCFCSSDGFSNSSWMLGRARREFRTKGPKNGMACPRSLTEKSHAVRQTISAQERA